MDASLLDQVDRELACERCGYSRAGLPVGSRCPECGDVPVARAPSKLVPIFRSIGAARDLHEQLWLAAVVAGLVLLVCTSVVALKVALVMPLGGLVLTAVNAPGPKVWAAVLLQRSIGNPGEWGMIGTVAVLGNVLAVWLATEPHPFARSREGLLSVRRCARWACVVLTGGLFGTLIGGLSISRDWGWDALPALAVAVGAVELVTNGLLYWHLALFSKRLAHGRVDRMLVAGAVLAPLVCATGAAMSLVRGQMRDEPVEGWRVAQALYGAVTVPAGMLMTAGVLRLVVRLLMAGVDAVVLSRVGRLARVRSTVGWLLATVRAEPTRWAALAGLALWLYNARPMLGLSTLMSQRQGFGGNLPVVNFVGPKVWAVNLLEGSYGYYRYVYGNRGAVLTTVLAIWLITSLRPRGTDAWRWAIARWAPTLLVGMAVGLAMTIDQASFGVKGSYWVAAAMVLVEAPATFVVYRYLALLAASRGGTRLATDLRAVAYAAVALIVSPLVFYILAEPLRGMRNHLVALLVFAIYGAAAVGVGVVAWALVAKLAWGLAAGPEAQIARAHAGGRQTPA